LFTEKKIIPWENNGKDSPAAIAIYGGECEQRYSADLGSLLHGSASAAELGRTDIAPIYGAKDLLKSLFKKQK
jgi:hypothetical protein